MSQCTATAKSTGERCQRPAIKGGTVCYQHGGAAGQVQKKAQERLDRMADEVSAAQLDVIRGLREMWEDADTEERLKIQKALREHGVVVYDRTGHGPTEKREHMGEGGGPLQIEFSEEVVTTDWEADE